MGAAPTKTRDRRTSGGLKEEGKRRVAIMPQEKEKKERKQEQKFLVCGVAGQVRKMFRVVLVFSLPYLGNTVHPARRVFKETCSK